MSIQSRSDSAAVTAPPRRLVAALLGNPNTGKTTLFNALSGLNHRVGNYPGVTVESKKGSMTCAGVPFDLVDLPGTYSLAPRSPDEMVAVDVILGRQRGQERPDVVVCIVDASNLERNLYLTTQALELGVPVVVALNMIDLAEAQGIVIDAAELSRKLGVTVVPIQASRKRGLDELRSAIAAAADGTAPTMGPVFPPAFEAEVKALRDRVGEDVPAFLVRRLLLDVGGHVESQLLPLLGSDGKQTLEVARERLKTTAPIPAVEARTRYGWIRQALAGCVSRPRQRPRSWTDRLDRILTHRVWGALIFLAVMFVLFESIYVVARPLMDLIDAGIGWLADAVKSSQLPDGAFKSLLAEGVIGGVGSVVIFLPQILILFAFIAILEDCGYMARAAFVMDRLMSRAGLSGKSFIPLLSSLACAVPGIMATRVIEDRRDRLATILVAPLMSCSARLPVYVLLIGAFLTEGYAWYVPGLVMFTMYLLGLVLAPLVAWVLKKTLLRGATPVFVMEMPSYKWPSLRTVLRRMLDAAGAFLKRAGTIILATTILVWALLNFPRGEYPDRIRELKAAGEAIEKLDKKVQNEEELDAAEAKALAQLKKERERLAALEKLTGKELTQIEKEEREALQVKLDPLAEANVQEAEWKRNSFLGRMGQAIEPAVKPLGWDWRIGVAALASFPAREVVVGVLGVLYQEGEVDAKDEQATKKLGEKMRPQYSLPTALSLMVFFALCCQCASTLAVIRRETQSWLWPAFTFGYMTALAYVAALAVYQVGILFT